MDLPHVRKSSHKPVGSESFLAAVPGQEFEHMEIPYKSFETCDMSFHARYNLVDSIRISIFGDLPEFHISQFHGMDVFHPRLRIDHQYTACCVGFLPGCKNCRGQLPLTGTSSRIDIRIVCEQCF